MSLGDHLEDLRRRLVLALLGLVPIVVTAFIFGDQIFEALISPVREALLKAGLPPAMQQTSVLETFFTYFQMAIIVAVVVGAPWIIYQLWRFVAPGLYQHEKRFAYLLFPMSLGLSFLGILFMYVIILPVMLQYFVNFGTSIGVHPAATSPVPEGVSLPTFPVLPADPPSPTEGQMWINGATHQLSGVIGGRVMRTDMGKSVPIVQQYRVGEWVGLFLSLMLASAGGFQMPVVVMLLGWAGIIDRPLMKKYRRHAIMGIIVAAAILTPTGDPFTLMLMSVPMYLLYELGGVLFTFLPPDRVAYGRGGAPKEGNVDDETPVDASKRGTASPLVRKAVDLVPNSLRSAGLLDERDDHDRSDEPPRRDWRPGGKP